jgi:hypothetical protein
MKNKGFTLIELLVVSRANLSKLTSDGGTMTNAFENGTDMSTTMQTP